MPKGVVCLLSALRFHGLTTQASFEVWLAIENKASTPRLDYPPLRVVRFSGAALALERMFYRLSISERRDQFLLKGALLFDLWFDVPHRPTHDADFLGFGSAGPSHLEGAFRGLCRTKVGDGIVFLPDSVKAAEIRKRRQLRWSSSSAWWGSPP